MSKTEVTPFCKPGTPYIHLRIRFQGKTTTKSADTTDLKTAREKAALLKADLLRQDTYGITPSVGFDHAAQAYLTDPTEPRSDGTEKRVRRLIAHFGSTPVAQIDQNALTEAFKSPLVVRPGSKPATHRRGVLTPLRAVLNYAADQGWCSKPPVFKRIKVVEPLITPLRPEQATALLDAAADHLRPLLVFLLCTGCRLSEALELDWKDVDLKGQQATVWMKQQTFRRAHLLPKVVAALSALKHRTGRVFRPVYRVKGGWAEGDAYYFNERKGGGQIDSGFYPACERAGIDNLSPHGLRHTWASWHYCVHKDLLLLKQEGGWATLSQVERYAHMMPAAYRDDIIAWQAAEPVETAKTANG